MFVHTYFCSYAIIIEMCIRDRGYIVRRLFLKSKMPLRDVTETHVQAVRELLHQGTGKSISLPHGFRAVNIYGFLEVRPLSPVSYTHLDVYKRQRIIISDIYV